MQRRSDVIRFAVVFTIVSAALAWAFWSSTAAVGLYRLNNSMLAVPIASVMLASVGFGWRRKIAYAVLTVGLYVGTDALAEFAGLHRVVVRQMMDLSAFPSLSVVLYMAWLTTFPFAMLVLFVGRKPALIWSRAVD